MGRKQYLIIIVTLIVAAVLVVAAFQLNLFNLEDKKKETTNKPIAEANGPYIGTANRLMLFNAQGSKDNAEGNNSILEYRWDFNNDGIYDIGWQPISAPIYQFKYTSTYNGQARLQVRDANGETSTDLAIVTLAAKPPTEPFLWKIEGEKPSYLYGSIHVGTEDLLTLPDVVMNALNQADVVYTEIKLDQATTYQTSLFCFLSGGTLDDTLPEELANRLDEYLKTKNYSINTFNMFKIWAIAVSLVQFEYPEYFTNYQGGLDQYIWDIATSKGKETYGLETPYEQLSIFDDLTLEEQIRYLNDSLTEIKDYSISNEDPLAELIDAYLDGDLEAYLELEYQEYDESGPLYEKLLTKLLHDRNYNMTERISENITNNSEKQFFFAVGAAHLYGEDGIITLLENKGYTITRVSFYECSDCDCDNGERKINNRCYVTYSPT